MKIYHAIIGTIFTLIFAAGVTACYKFITADWNTPYLHTALSEKGKLLGYNWPIIFYSSHQDVLLACQEYNANLLGCAIWPIEPGKEMGSKLTVPAKNCTIFIWSEADKQTNYSMKQIIEHEERHCTEGPFHGEK